MAEGVARGPQGWATDPGLLATFRAEIEDRLDSLTSGLLALEGGQGTAVGPGAAPGRAPRQVLRTLRRDAHTVKGSARLLGVDAVVTLAHRLEDALATVPDDGGPDPAAPRVLVEAMLAAVEVMGRALPGTVDPPTAAQVDAAVAALVAYRAPGVSGVSRVPAAPAVPRVSRAPGSPGPGSAAALVAGGGPSREAADRMAAHPFAVPAPGPGAAQQAVPPPGPFTPVGATAAPVTPAVPVVPAVPLARGVPAVPAGPGPSGTAVRLPARRLHDLLDAVGEAHLQARRVEAQVARLVTDGQALDAPADRAEAAGTPGTACSAGPSGTVDALQCLQETSAEAVARLDAVLQATLGLAMVPLGRAVHGLDGLVRRVAGQSGKQVGLEVDGADVELDARVLDGLGEALRHLVTNAVDHGVDDPAARAAAGRPPAGVVRVRARPAGASVVVEVSDDGAGVDVERVRDAAVTAGLVDAGARLDRAEALQLLFAPGLSTRSTVSETSGRGVGLDAVRSSVEELGGTVEVESEPGAGTRFRLTVPQSLGVLRCVVVTTGGERYAVPAAAVRETVRLKDEVVGSLAGLPCLVRAGRPIPLVDLGAALDVPAAGTSPAEAGQGRGGYAVLLQHRHGPLAWSVDRLDREGEVVVKELGPWLGRLPLLSAAILDEDGSVVLVLDPRELGERHAGAAASGPAVATAGTGTPRGASGAPPAGQGVQGVQGAEDVPGVTGLAGVPGARGVDASVTASRGRRRVLVVEDSVGVRELQRALLAGAGYDVTLAVDGADGARHLDGPPYDLVLTDVEMPRMDGFELTRAVRRTPGWRNVPVVVMTSRGGDEDRRAGMDAGASAYLLKTQFSQDELLSTVRRLTGGPASPSPASPSPASPSPASPSPSPDDPRGRP